MGPGINPSYCQSAGNGHIVRVLMRFGDGIIAPDGRHDRADHPLNLVVNYFF
jgi:hypothetical protein